MAKQGEGEKPASFTKNLTTSLAMAEEDMLGLREVQVAHVCRQSFPYNQEKGHHFVLSGIWSNSKKLEHHVHDQAIQRKCYSPIVNC